MAQNASFMNSPTVYPEVMLRIAGLIGSIS